MIGLPVFFPCFAFACAALAAGLVSTPERDVSRLRAELAQLRAENRVLRQELSRLRGQDADTEGNRIALGLQLFAPAPGGGDDTGKVVFRWRTCGEGQAARPVSLYYAERAADPWRLIATDLPGEGTYAWDRPAGVPARLFLSCRARDRCGKEVKAETPELILIDLGVDREP